MINAAIVAAAAAHEDESAAAAAAAMVDFDKAAQSSNIAMERIRWDDIVPPMRRNGAAWQPSHSTKRKNKIRRQRAAGGRA